jgi:RNA polymerase sigma factor (sigma-70 family)
MPAADFALQQDHSSPVSAAQSLYQQHHGWLHGWLRYKLGNTFDAADLAHDTFIRILAGRDIGAISQPRAYLTTVARGILINWYQRQALERAYLDAIALLPEAQAPSCEAQYLIMETLYQVDAMLDALPAVVRRTFLLSQLEGWTYEAIALRLDISLASVKRYMKQAFLACLQLEH